MWVRKTADVELFLPQRLEETDIWVFDIVGQGIIKLRATVNLHMIKHD